MFPREPAVNQRENVENEDLQKDAETVNLTEITQTRLNPNNGIKGDSVVGLEHSAQ